MKRREFTTLIGGAAVALPLAARPRRSVIPVIGFLHQRSLQPNTHTVDALRRGLQESGYVEDRNVARRT